MQTDEWFSARKAEMLPLPATKWAIMAQEAAALAYEDLQRTLECGDVQAAKWKQRAVALESRSARAAADRARREMAVWRRLEAIHDNAYDFIEAWNRAGALERVTI